MGRAMVAGGCLGMNLPGGIQAGSLSVGSVVKLMEGSTAVEYLVVNQGIPGNSSVYDSSCDGTWLLRKNIHSGQYFDQEESNNYGSSDINAWLNGTFFNSLGSVEQAVIKQVSIPYRRGAVYSDTLSCKIFILSEPEVHAAVNFTDGMDGAALAYFAACSTSGADSKRVALRDGASFGWWLRTPAPSGTDYALLCKADGQPTNLSTDSAYGARPALILPKTALFDKTTLQLKGVA